MGTTRVRGDDSCVIGEAVVVRRDGIPVEVGRREREPAAVDRRLLPGLRGGPDAQ